MKYLKSLRPEIPLIFLFTFAVYINNLSHSVYGGDSGDFLATIITRGVAHPSGYPLYTMLGIIATWLPFNLTYAAKVGLVSCLFASLSVVLTYLIAQRLTNNRIISTITGLTLAFSYPFWIYAEVAEVFALHSFFLLFITYLTIKIVDSWDDTFFYLLCLVVGLSLTNNMTIVLSFPGVGLALLLSQRKKLFRLKTIFFGILYFVFGLIPYIYIPLAAAVDPAVNWGVAKTSSNFWALVARQDYGWINTAVDQKLILLNVGAYISYLKVYLNPVIIAVSALGVIYLIFKKRFAIFSILFLNLILLGPFFIIYARSKIYDFLALGILEKFYIGTILSMCLFFSYGILASWLAIKVLVKRPIFYRHLQKLVLAVFFIVASSQFLSNFPKTNFSNVSIGDRYGEDILLPLPPNSIIFLTSDTTAFNARYMQIAYGVRPDIYIPGKDTGFEELLRGAGVSEDEIKKYDVAQKGSIDKDLLHSLLIVALTQRPVFTETAFKPKEGDQVEGRISSIPYGFLFKMGFRQDEEISNEQYLNDVEKYIQNYQLGWFEENRDVVENNLVFSDIQTSYSLAFQNISLYLAEVYQDDVNSKLYLDKARDLFPGVKN